MMQFDDIFEDKTKYGTKIKTDQYHDSGKFPIIDQGQKQIAGYTDIEEGLFSEVPVIIFGDHTRIIKYIDEPFFLGADGVKVLRCKLPEPNYKYLYYALRNIRIPDTGYNRHFKWLKEANLSYPDSVTQNIICGVLDKITRVINYRNQQLHYLDDLIKARFVEMFGNPIYNPNNLPIKTLNDLGTWNSGGTPSRANPDYFKGNINWYSAGELNSLFLQGSIEQITYEAINMSSAKLFKAGSMLVGMYDTAAFKMGILKEESSSNQACACIEPYSNVDIIWLYYELQLMKDHFLSLRRGVRQKNLNLGMIKGFEIPVPNYPCQRDFSSFVAQVDKSKAVVQKALDETQLLFNSLMQQYFG